jgi:hypothetical protein
MSDDLHWWFLEGDPVYCGVALVAAATVERAIELVVDMVRDDLEVDDPFARGWHSSADELAPGVAQCASNLPAPPGAEGVYFESGRMPREWSDEELETLMRERERDR